MLANVKTQTQDVLLILSKAAFESTKAYAKRNRSNKNSKSTSDASSKAAFAASTKAYAGKKLDQVLNKYVCLHLNSKCLN